MGEIEEDTHLAQGGHQVEGEEEDGGEAERLQEADGRHKYHVAGNRQEKQDLEWKVFGKNVFGGSGDLTLAMVAWYEPGPAPQGEARPPQKAEQGRTQTTLSSAGNTPKRLLVALFR